MPGKADTQKSKEEEKQRSREKQKSKEAAIKRNIPKRERETPSTNSK